jgi:bromodomain-containing protein 8
MTEITAVKSGSMDKVLKDEIRGVLARKYGKKLLDSWVPDADAIKEAVEAGPPTDEELKAIDTAAEAEVKGAPGPEDATAVVDGAKEPEVLVEETQAPGKEEDQEEGDVTMKEPSASPTKPTTPAPQAAEASSPADKDESAVSPASDLSSPPGSPVKLKGGRGAFKRKASAQPRGAPVSKRSTKRRNTATPAVEEETPTEEPEAEKEEEEADPVELVPETPAPVEDEPPKRGRRSTKRESVVRRPSTRKATSPETSTRHSSPINPKRGLSASSARSNSATPAAEGRPRRGRKGRGVVSKLAREQSAAEESAKEDDEMTPKAGEADEEEAEADEETEKEAKVEAEKDEEEEEERPTTRTSRRTKSTAAPVEKEEEQDEDEEDEEEKPPPRTSRRGKDVETPVPEKTKEVEKKSTRRSSARGGQSQATLYMSPSNDTVAPAEEEEKPEIKEEPKAKTIKRPRASSPREFKATKTMLNNLLDQISSHKHGSMFANPVKPVRVLYSTKVSVDK